MKYVYIISYSLQMQKVKWREFKYPSKSVTELERAFRAFCVAHSLFPTVACVGKWCGFIGEALEENVLGGEGRF